MKAYFVSSLDKFPENGKVARLENCSKIEDSSEFWRSQTVRVDETLGEGEITRRQHHQRFQKDAAHDGLVVPGYFSF